MNLLLAHKMLLAIPIGALAVISFLIDTFTAIGPFGTTIIASCIATLSAYGVVVLKARADRKVREIDREREEDQQAAGSIDKISEVLATYRTHIDKMMDEHIARMNSFYGEQMLAKDILIKQKDAVIEMQATLLTQAGVQIGQTK